MICYRCGKELNEDDVFCSKCGTAVIVNDEQPEVLKQDAENIGTEDDFADSLSAFIEEIPVAPDVKTESDKTEDEDFDSFSVFIGEVEISRVQKEEVIEIEEELIDSSLIYVDENKSSNDIPIAKKSQPKVNTILLESEPVKVQEPASVVPNKDSKDGDKKKGRLSPKKKLAIKITAIVLAFCILLSSISVALVYFNVIDIPFIREMFNKMGLHDYIAEFNSLTGEFTDIKITDDESAIEAARDGAKQLGLEDAVQELSIIYSEDVNGMTYYRIQQHYDGIPVYGKTITVSADEDGTATGFASNIRLWTDTSEKSSITTEQAQFAFRSYAVANGLSETGDVVVLPFNETDVYYQTDSGELCLSKQLSVSVDGVPYEGVIDASSGEVYVMDCLQRQDMVQATGTDLDGNPITFDVYQEDDGTYSLKDTERNITMYDSGGNTCQYMYHLKTSENKDYYYSRIGENWFDEQFRIITQDKTTQRYFDVNGNDVTTDINSGYVYNLIISTLDSAPPPSIPTSNSANWGDSLSANVAVNVQISFDYFYRNFARNSFDGKGTQIIVIFNDHLYLRSETGKDGSKRYIFEPINAYSATDSPDYGTILAFGAQNPCQINDIAHEYTHSVEGSISDMEYSYESGAIMEGYSDIFGELVEAYAGETGKCDWVISSRNIIVPAQSKKPQPNKYHGDYWHTDSSDNGGVHYNSTVISHAAYLMSQDSSNGLLSYDELADLWYNTLYFLPKNCSFIAFRDYMEMTADILGFSDKKIECIKKAFEEAGIGEQFSYEVEVCSRKSTISVSDVNGDAYGNYTIIIEGNKQGTFGSVGKLYSDVIEVTSAEPYQLDLPKGTYSLTIHDTATGRFCAQKVYKMVDSSSNNELVFASDFGEMDIPESTAIAAFKQLLTNSGDVWQFNYENGQFASMSNAEIIENFIACMGVPIGVYNVYSSEGIQFTAEILEENAYADPKGVFWYSYELDASLVDWILQNIFGKTPDRSITSDNVYYNGDKVYVRMELGGDLGYTYSVTNYEKKSDGKYEIYVESKRSDYGSEITYLKFTATPKQDSTHGIYWQIHSYEKITDVDVIEPGPDDGYIENGAVDYKVGDYITFGSYEQDNNTANGKEKIEWLILDIQNGQALVISKYALDAQLYNVNSDDVTWETCTLRRWLNDDFINAAFSSEEQKRIKITTVVTEDNRQYSTDGGNVTQDKIFLLSISEVQDYFGYPYEKSRYTPTAYALAEGCLINTTDEIYYGNCYWWLRSPGKFQEDAAYVSSTGRIVDGGYIVNSAECAVCPVMWIALD